MRVSPNEWVCIISIGLSLSTAETLAKLLSYEHAVDLGDFRFAASGRCPSSIGWRADERDSYFKKLENRMN